jgi:hypothetical protein
MEIAVSYYNKDLVKNLGCKWDSSINRWICPLTINETNLNDLIKLQHKDVLGFIKKSHLKNEDEDYNEKQNYFDLGYKYIYIYETYTEQEIKDIVRPLRNK